MKQQLQLKQNLKLNFQLSQTMKQSLDILKMNQSQLHEFIHDFIQRNPIIQYTPTLELQTYLQDTMSLQISLKDELYMQLHTTNYTYDESICNFIIESLDDHGFLSYTIQEYAQFLNTSLQKIHHNIEVLQTFEPIGVCAKNSLDSIKIQLKTKQYIQALYIFEHYPYELQHKLYEQIATSMHISKQTVLTYLKQIQSCSPFPCSSYINDTPSYLLPDFEIIVEDEEIHILPKQLYHFHMDDEVSLEKNQIEQLKSYFQEAYFFIDAIHKRNKTLLILMNELIHIQKNYFLYKDELQPCTLQMIAKASGFHESTISRTLSNKYYIFQNEVYPVKNLFVSSTKDGSSKDSIEKALLYLIKEEDKSKPYSDQQLVTLLENLDLYVSRRTITKYRNLLHIPSSKERKIEKI